MQRSEQIADLTAALAKAQSEIEGAIKTSENPHFRNRYADLGAVWEAIRGPLTKHGLSVVQFPRACEMGVEVETTLFHTSGQFMSDTLALPVLKRDAQGFGSAITYARRYALMAVAGIAPVDDDGNEASKGALGNGSARDEMGKKDAWEEWAKGDKKSDCAAWLNQAANELRELVSNEDVGKWLKVAHNAKRIAALHDHHEARYDWLMTKVGARQDELRAKEAA